MSPFASLIGILCVFLVGSLAGAAFVYFHLIATLRKQPGAFGNFFSQALAMLAQTSGHTHLHLLLGPETEIAHPDGSTERFPEELPVAVPVHSVCQALRHEVPQWIIPSRGARS